MNMAQQPVSVSLADLKEGSVSFSTLEDAFGPTSLGILIVSGLPDHFAELRSRLLSYSSYLANLSPERLEQLESAESKYLVGWSCGKETLKDGRYDTLKGSYYVNCAPAFEEPGMQAKLADQYPSFSEYTAPNIWPPEEDLPGFEKTFRLLCELIIDTAVLVAKACDRYAEEKIDGYGKGYLEHVVKSSVVTKARLLHYFPPVAIGHDDSGGDLADDDWCGTHRDHGCLTGLTSGMFVDEAANNLKVGSKSPNGKVPLLEELSSAPDSRAGLYIHSREGEVVKVGIPRDCLAFQTGEALEVITQKKFKAVPHFVRGASAGKGSTVARNTLAVFTQPNLDELVDTDAGKDFATFAREIVARNH